MGHIAQFRYNPNVFLFVDKITLNMHRQSAIHLVKTEKTNKD